MIKGKIFVTGIGTGVGKTLVSAVLVEKLNADYWKPVQSGDLDNSDMLTVKSLISNTATQFHPEAYRLTQPFSPHKSADLDGIIIDPDKITAPATDNILIIEGAGGLMVPLNDQFLMIDLIKKLDAEVVLVSQNYLGSINHTLLSIIVLKQYGIPVKGLIFNGVKERYTEDIILNYSGIKLLGHLPEYNVINTKAIVDAGSCIAL
ncbi:MAG TPA: dethiobiotin synthase [Mucilaginibacter sp.]|jgi:dethiobiotin synthetase|nr:dethiobiotin synthase [Mucilaginibacter sp.]